MDEELRKLVEEFASISDRALVLRAEKAAKDKELETAEAVRSNLESDLKKKFSHLLPEQIKVVRADPDTCAVIRCYINSSQKRAIRVDVCDIEKP